MPGSPPPRRGTSAGLIIGGSVLGLVVLLALAAVLPIVVSRLHTSRLVVTSRQVAAVPVGTPTAPSAGDAIRGYYAPVGKHGRPLMAGQPWGLSCEPIRITVEEHVPAAVYVQIVAVVNQARRDGIDITMENRQFLWKPASLYYPAGSSPASVERVGIFSSSAPPQRISNGHLERLALGWDTALLPGDRAEAHRYAGHDGTRRPVRPPSSRAHRGPPGHRAQPGNCCHD